MVSIGKLIMPTSIIIFLFATSKTSIAQQYCIDQSDYIRWLCNNVRGAEHACSAPSYIGKFPDYNSCNIARINNLPYDFRWQQMTKCVPCGPSKKPDSSYQDFLIRQQEEEMRRRQEEERLIDEVRREVIKEDTASKEYLKNIQKEKEQKSNETKNMIKDITQQMKVSVAPMSSFQEEHYRKTLEQMYCIAYISIQAAELALRGNFDISKDLLTDIESVREMGGAGFNDKINSKFLSSCPKNINFQIPEVYTSIEKDPQYLRYNEIVKTVRTLVPKIQNIGKELEQVKAQKEQIQKGLEKIDLEIKEIKAKKLAVDPLEKKTDVDDLLAKALELKQKAESEYQEALQNEQKLMEEKQKIEKELNGIKSKMFMEVKR